MFWEYYTNLYTAAPSQEHLAKKFHERMDITTLPTAQLDTLNVPITDVDIDTAIKGLAMGKAPGLDGYTSMFYKTFRETFLPTLSKVYTVI